MSVNKVILVGRLGADPEMKYSQNGKAICKFSVATDSGWGENKQTDWHRVTAFDKVAESCGKFLAKGRQVYLEGRVSYRKWEKDDGSVQWFTEILANEVKFLGDRGEAQPNANQGQRTNQGQQRSGNYGGQQQGQQGQQQGGNWGGFSDDDIPF